MLLNLLWADDLILVSTSVSGTQKQLDGLDNFGIKNQTIVNGAKTKIIVFGKQLDVNATYQGTPIEQVRQYKYLGNIVRPVVHISGDLFSDTYSHPCEKARKSIYVMQRKLQGLGTIPPSCMLCLFDSCIQPILTYGSKQAGVWNCRQNISLVPQNDSLCESNDQQCHNYRVVW